MKGKDGSIEGPTKKRFTAIQGADGTLTVKNNSQADFSLESIANLKPPKGSSTPKQSLTRTAKRTRETRTAKRTKPSDSILKCSGVNAFLSDSKRDEVDLENDIDIDDPLDDIKKDLENDEKIQNMAGKGKKDLIKEKKQLAQILPVTEKLDTSSDFHRNFVGNETFFVLGKAILPSSLIRLLPPRGSKVSMWLTSETTLAYAHYLVQMKKDLYPNIKLAMGASETSDYILSEFMKRETKEEVNEENFERRLLLLCRLFIKEDIPLHDVSFFPLTFGGHCSLAIVIRKHKLMIHLDSLYTDLSRPTHAFKMLLMMHRAYWLYHGRKFDSENWRLINFNKETLVHHQSDSVNCAIFVLLYLETILTSSSLKLQMYSSHKKLLDYRREVKNNLISQMKIFEGKKSARGK